MANNTPFYKRSRVFILLGLIIAIILCYYYRLMQLQLVNGEYYSAISQRSFTSSSVLPAARGEIFDRNGRPYAVNTTGYSIVFQRNFLGYGKENETIKNLIDILRLTDEKWNDTLPITENAPYEFTDDETSVAALKKFLRLNNYATVDNCLSALRKKYDIPENDKYMRELCGVRYEMDLREFSPSNDYTFSGNISVSTAAKIGEMSYEFAGVAINEIPQRNYVASTNAPHVIGLVGAMNAEEYKELKSSGYKMNDYVGKFGAEYAFEEYLKGTDGRRNVVQDKNGNIISMQDSVASNPGNSVILTLDQRFQEGLQKIVSDHAAWLRQKGDRGKNVKAISVVVLDVHDGGLLAGVNYPSYDLNEYYENYSALLSAENNPLFNRFCNGLYRPGSTFKTMMSMGGITEGVITASETINCKHVYDYYDDYRPTCLGHHGKINVVSALGYSCNVFFFEVGRRMGITKIGEYAKIAGFGQKTGIEIGEEQGRIASPSLTRTLGGTWYSGDVLQAAIGQQETALTPIQMAAWAMMIANKGVRYKTHLLKEVRSYDLSEPVYEYVPEIAYETDIPDSTFDTITKGMQECARLSGSTYGLTSYKLTTVAIKTGSPQISTTKENHCVIGFAPAEDPQIAFCIMQEEGYYSPKLCKNMLELYFSEEEATTPERYGVLLN